MGEAPDLSFHLVRGYFSRYRGRGFVYEPGERPETLGAGSPSQRAWKAFQSRQGRENPIRVAERLREEFDRAKYRTYAQLADHFGVTRATVTYYMALLTKLPDDFVAWLRSSDDPEVLGCFCERRLRPIARLGSDHAKVIALRHLVREGVESGLDDARSAPARYRSG